MNPPNHRFCGACGASLVGDHEPAPSRVEGRGRGTDGFEARKVVTVVFADLIGSTGLHERLDAESVRSLMARYYGVLRAVVDAHGGTVVKLLGDGVMAAFGLPHVAEDDALRAVRAALAMQEAFRALAREQSGIGLRVAVNSGEVVVDAATDDVVGDPINVAARLQDVARDGDVVVGEATRRLVGALVTLEPLGPVALRGRAETVAAYRVVSLERPAGSSAVAFVGRDDELRRLAAVHEAAVAARGRILTWDHRGRVDVSRQLGTMRDGGPFEHVFVRVFMTDGPHIRRYEFFDAADTERALARFAELCRAES